MAAEHVAIVTARLYPRPRGSPGFSHHRARPVPQRPTVPRFLWPPPLHLPLLVRPNVLSQPPIVTPAAESFLLVLACHAPVSTHADCPSPRPNV